jgi:hypothetical protein
MDISFWYHLVMETVTKTMKAQNVIHDLASLCGWRSAKKKDRYRHGPHRNASE